MCIIEESIIYMIGKHLVLSTRARGQSESLHLGRVVGSVTLATKAIQRTIKMPKYLIYHIRVVWCGHYSKKCGICSSLSKILMLTTIFKLGKYLKGEFQKLRHSSKHTGKGATFHQLSFISWGGL